MWPIGISTGIAYRHPIDVVLEPIRAAGLERIEVSTAPQHIDLGERGGASPTWRGGSGKPASSSIRCTLRSGTTSTSRAPTPACASRSIERLVRAADALAILGGGLYVIHPGGEDQRWVWERESRLAMSVEGLCRIREVCVARGLTLVVETPLPHLLGGQPDDFAWILARIPAGAHRGLHRHLPLLARWLPLRRPDPVRRPARPSPGQRQPGPDRRPPALRATVSSTGHAFAAASRPWATPASSCSRSAGTATSPSTSRGRPRARAACWGWRSRPDGRDHPSDALLERRLTVHRRARNIVASRGRSWFATPPCVTGRSSGAANQRHGRAMTPEQ